MKFETRLDQARRRVRDGAYRVKRQHDLINEMIRAGRDVTSATALLEIMVETLQFMRTDLAQLECKA